jgi:hypothetical protein
LILNSTLALSNWGWYTGEVFIEAWLKSILDLSQPDNIKASQSIAAGFQSCNKIKEVVDRHLAALSPSRLNLASPQLLGLLSHWEQENAGIYGNPIEEAALKAKIDSRSYLRLFFKRDYDNENLAASLLLHCPKASSVKPYRDYDGFLTQIDYYYSQDKKQYIERQFLQKKLTVFQTIFEDKVVQEFSLDLGGGLTVVEVNLPALVTESLRQNQTGINFALTLLPHNLAYSGWIQESILNAQPPGTWSYDDAGREVFTPSGALPTGAGVSRFIQGLPLRDDRGQITGYTQPDLRNTQPIDPQTFIQSFRAFSLAIYEQCHQSFVIGADLPLSGISREQARKDFHAVIAKDARLLGYALSDLFSVANHLIGIKEKVAVKVLPELDVDIEEKKLAIEASGSGLVSRRTAIEKLGFAADVDFEMAELDKEKPSASPGADGGSVSD